MNMKKRLIGILIFAILIVAGQALAESNLSIEVFGTNGEKITLSQNEVDAIASTCPSVRQIIANFETSARGGTDLYISFLTKDGRWKNTSAGIGNPDAPTYWHIRNLLKDVAK